MTVIFSSILNNLIVMVSDSAVTQTFSDSRRYETTKKFYPFEGVGCVTTWGRHNGNKIGSFLEKEIPKRKIRSVVNLATLTDEYIRIEFRPPDFDDPEEVGYHIGGFDSEGRPRLYHIFWGCNRPRTSVGETPDYHFYDHSDWDFLYNGRNDLAHSVVNILINQVRSGEANRFDIASKAGRIRFCDFVVRFAAELTPEVSPPFAINLIFPNNEFTRIFNKSFAPIILSDDILLKIGGSTESPPYTPFGIPPNQPVYELPTGTSLPEDFWDNQYPYTGGTAAYLRPKARTCLVCGEEFELPPEVRSISAEPSLPEPSICPECKAKRV